MPQSTGLYSPTKNKNNPAGDLVHMGGMIDSKIYETFTDTCKRRCLTKTAVIRALITDFAETGKLPGHD